MVFLPPGPPKSSPDDDERTKTLQAAESKIKPHISPDDLTTIRHHSKTIVGASVGLHGTKSGIGYKPDEDFGTNKHVFSILGPHLGHYYGDIFIVFKREIMYHPDANFSIQAATTFGQSRNAYQQRPWLKDPGDDKQRTQHYHWTKLHCSVPGYDYAAAMELMALTGVPKKTMDVTLDQIEKRWMSVDSHMVFESHLPQLIPLDYIDHVYIPKNIFESLSSASQDFTKKTFEDHLTITNHIVDLTQMKQLDSTRQPYQKYVIDQINDQIKKNSPQTHYGINITLPASDFQQYTLIPMTILQSTHRYQAGKDASDTIYIYWEALGGDMTVALSKEPIDTKYDQSSNRCLLCCIADIVVPSPDQEYHEPYSYITVGYPFSHEILVAESNF